MPDYNMSEREAAAVLRLGKKIERDTSNMTTGLALFNIEGGNCQLNLIVGEVTSQLVAQAYTFKLQANPDTGTTTDLCGTLSINADQEGVLYTIEGTPGTALQEGDTGSVAGPTFPSILAPGTIDIVVSTPVSGSVKWTLWYIPLEIGAYIEAT